MSALAGRRVVVTRALDQASELTSRLEAAGAAVVVVPTIAITGRDAGLQALRAALASDADWAVVTSTNGAAQLAAALEASASVGAIAAVGPRTAKVLEERGHRVALVAKPAVAEALVEAFPAGEGRVVLAQAARTRGVVAPGLRAKGWTVEEVIVYETVPATIDAPLLEAVRGADAITFTSSSTVTSFLAAGGGQVLPPVVACIGPITAATARDAGLAVTVVAEKHTLDGLVRALEQHFEGAS